MTEFYILSLISIQFRAIIRIGLLLVASLVTAAWLYTAMSHGVSQLRIEAPFLSNPSIGATFLVGVFLYFGIVSLALVPASLTLKATPLAMIWVYVFYKYGWARIPLLFLTGLFLVHHGFPSDTGRFEVWRLYAEWWTTLPWDKKLFGMGLDFTKVGLPMIQLAHGYKDNFFLWAHNDYLQALVELGLAGFFGVSLLGINLFLKANSGQRIMLAVFATAMITNFPWHYTPMLFLMYLWIGDIVGGRGNEWSSNIQSLKNWISKMGVNRRFTGLKLKGLISRLRPAQRVSGL